MQLVTFQLLLVGVTGTVFFTSLGASLTYLWYKNVLISEDDAVETNCSRTKRNSRCRRTKTRKEPKRKEVPLRDIVDSTSSHLSTSGQSTPASSQPESPIGSGRVSTACSGNLPSPSDTAIATSSACNSLNSSTVSSGLELCESSSIGSSVSSSTSTDSDPHMLISAASSTSHPISATAIRIDQDAINSTSRTLDSRPPINHTQFQSHRRWRHGTESISHDAQLPTHQQESESSRATPAHTQPENSQIALTDNSSSMEDTKVVENMFKLLMYNIADDQARKEGFVHRSITCNQCGISPIRGIRFKCCNCCDFDLCETCEAYDTHISTHVFIKILIPVPPLANPRRTLCDNFYPGTEPKPHKNESPSTSDSSSPSNSDSDAHSPPLSGSPSAKNNGNSESKSWHRLGEEESIMNSLNYQNTTASAGAPTISGDELSSSLPMTAKTLSLSILASQEADILPNAAESVPDTASPNYEPAQSSLPSIISPKSQQPQGQATQSALANTATREIARTRTNSSQNYNEANAASTSDTIQCSSSTSRRQRSEISHSMEHEFTNSSDKCDESQYDANATQLRMHTNSESICDTVRTATSGSNLSTMIAENVSNFVQSEEQKKSTELLVTRDEIKNQGSRLTREEVQSLISSTGFTEPEIKAMWEQFRALSGIEGCISRPIFDACLGPVGRTKNLIHARIFHFYDKDSDGVIGFNDFISGLNVLAHGTFHQKVKALFRFYDLKNAGRISRCDLSHIFKAQFGLSVTKIRESMKAERDNIMEHFDSANNSPLSATFTVPIPTRNRIAHHQLNRNQAWRDLLREETPAASEIWNDVMPTRISGANINHISSGQYSSSSDSSLSSTRSSRSSSSSPSYGLASRTQTTALSLSPSSTPFNAQQNGGHAVDLTHHQGGFWGIAAPSPVHLDSPTSKEEEASGSIKLNNVFRRMLRKTREDSVDSVFSKLDPEASGAVDFDHFVSYVEENTELVAWFEKICGLF